MIKYILLFVIIIYIFLNYKIKNYNKLKEKFASDSRCGRSEADARISCAKDCNNNEDCGSPEQCFYNLPMTPCRLENSASSGIFYELERKFTRGSTEFGGENIKKPILLLIYDRYDANSKYFYDYFASPREFDTDGLITTELRNLPQPKFFENLSGSDYEFAMNNLNDFYDLSNNDIDQDLFNIFINHITTGPGNVERSEQFISLYNSISTDLINPISDFNINNFDSVPKKKNFKKAINEMFPLEIVGNNEKIFLGKHEPWNQLKTLYKDINHNHFNNKLLNLGEIFLPDGKYDDFENLDVNLITGGGRIAKENLRQIFKPEGLIDKIPMLLLIIPKFKDKEDVEDGSFNSRRGQTQPERNDEIESLQKGSDIYNLLEFKYIKYEGIYNLNNRGVKTAHDNVLKFIDDSFHKHTRIRASSKNEAQAKHQSRLHSSLSGGHTLGSGQSIGTTDKSIYKCNSCCEFYIGDSGQ